MPTAAGSELERRRRAAGRDVEARQPGGDRRRRRRRRRAARSSAPRRRSRATTTISAAGTRGAQEAQRQQDRERGRADRDAWCRSTSPISRDDLDELRERVARVDVEPEQLAELADDQHDRDAVDVADQHGPREVVGDPAEPQRAGRAGSTRRRAAPAWRPARRPPRCPRPRAPAPPRATSAEIEPSGPTISCRDEPSSAYATRRKQQRVEAGDRGEAGELRVGHRGRHRERRDGQPRRSGRLARRPRAIAGKLPGHRDGALSSGPCAAGRNGESPA